MTSNVPEPIDPRQLRVSDKEREAVAEQLRVAAGDGRLDLGELEERITAVYSAKTYAELEPITRDLPSATTPASSSTCCSAIRRCMRTWCCRTSHFRRS